MTKEQLRQFIITNYKRLLSKDRHEYKNAYDNLTALFFEKPKGLRYSKMPILDQWLVIQAVTLSLIRGLLEDNDTERVKIVRKTYVQLREQVELFVVTEDDKYIFSLSDEKFNEEILKLILKQN